MCTERDPTDQVPSPRREACHLAGTKAAASLCAPSWVTQQTTHTSRPGQGTHPPMEPHKRGRTQVLLSPARTRWLRGKPGCGSVTARPWPDLIQKLNRGLLHSEKSPALGYTRARGQREGRMR